MIEIHCFPFGFGVGGIDQYDLVGETRKEKGISKRGADVASANHCDAGGFMYRCYHKNFLIIVL
jgi:hypothetical protein